MATVLSVMSGPATVSGNTVTLTGAGSVTLEVSQAGDIEYYLFAFLSQSFVVTKALAPITLSDLTQNYDGTPKSAVVATNPTGLNVSLTYNGGTAAPSAAGSYAVQATVNDPNYQGVAAGTLVIGPLAQTITFSQPAVFGSSPPFVLQASASSQLPVTFTLLSGPASLSGSTLTLTAEPGIVTVVAGQAGNAAYLAAPPVTVAFNVSLAAPLVNVSIFGQVGSVQNAIVAGFVIAGVGTKPMLFRGVGPTLAGYGVTGVLAAPMLQLYDGSGTLLLSNSGWGDSSSLSSLFTQVGAFPLMAGSTDAAASTSLSPGSYTLRVSGVSGATGTALAEVYDVSSNPLAQTTAVINVSSLAQVSPGAPITAGFVIGGSTSTQVLIRGVGPSLGSFGMNGVLSDPFLSISDGNGTLIAQNDNWEVPLTVNNLYPAASAAAISAAASAAGAFQLDPGSNDASILVTLAPGPYSAQVSAVGAATGSTLIEVYEVP